jgi:acyl-CoA dehydrogenase
MSATIPALRGGEAALLSEVAQQVLASVPDDPWTPLVDGGWIGVGIDEAKGGQGGGVAEAVALMDAQGRTAAAVPLLEAVIAAQLAAGATGTDELVAQMVRGETRATLVPGVVTAGRRDGAYVLSGAPWLVPWAAQSDVALVTARADEELRIVVLPREDLRIERGLNLAREPRDLVAPLNAAVAAGATHPLLTRLDHLLALTALLSAARLAGALSATHALTLQYARERHQFGRPIGSFQTVAHALARQAGEVELAAAALDAAVVKAGDPSAAAAALTARVVAGTVAPSVADVAHQLHGAIGVTREYALHELTLRLRAWPQELGTTRWWQRRLARQAAGAEWWDRTAPERSP